MFTPELVAALREGQRRVEIRARGELRLGSPACLRYQVFASRIPGVFSLGGDLKLFRQLIDRGDRQGLHDYAMACVDLVYANATGHGLPLTTISLVQGQALGGGVEAALAAHVVVAERSSKMGLPEVLFNMFPGMGAYQLLTRRISPVEAERLILSGRTHTAAELYDMGLVDVIAEDGQGEAAVWSFIRRQDRHAHARHGLRRAIATCSPVDYEGLRRMADVWVDTAFGLGRRDLEVVDYLIRAQARGAG
jgi:DSF synthase